MMWCGLALLALAAAAIGEIVHQRRKRRGETRGGMLLRVPAATLLAALLAAFVLSGSVDRRGQSASSLVPTPPPQPSPPPSLSPPAVAEGGVSPHGNGSGPSMRRARAAAAESSSLQGMLGGMLERLLPERLLPSWVQAAARRRTTHIAEGWWVPPSPPPSLPIACATMPAICHSATCVSYVHCGDPSTADAACDHAPYECRIRCSEYAFCRPPPPPPPSPSPSPSSCRRPSPGRGRAVEVLCLGVLERVKECRGCCPQSSLVKSLCEKRGQEG